MINWKRGICSQQKCFTQSQRDETGQRSASQGTLESKNQSSSWTVDKRLSCLEKADEMRATQEQTASSLQNTLCYTQTHTHCWQTSTEQTNTLWAYSRYMTHISSQSQFYRAGEETIKAEPALINSHTRQQEKNKVETTTVNDAQTEHSDSINRIRRFYKIMHKYDSVITSHLASKPSIRSSYERRSPDAKLPPPGVQELTVDVTAATTFTRSRQPRELMLLSHTDMKLFLLQQLFWLDP